MKPLTLKDMERRVTLALLAMELDDGVAILQKTYDHQHIEQRTILGMMSFHHDHEPVNWDWRGMQHATRYG